MFALSIISWWLTLCVCFIGKSNDRRVPNMDILRKHLLREGHLNKQELLEIIKDATKIMSKSLQLSLNLS